MEHLPITFASLDFDSNGELNQAQLLAALRAQERIIDGLRVSVKEITSAIIDSVERIRSNLNHEVAMRVDHQNRLSELERHAVPYTDPLGH